MKKLLLIFILFLQFALCFAQKTDYKFNPDLSPIKYGVEFFTEMEHGNHRAVVACDRPGECVLAHIEWRRHDDNPASKGIIVENSNGERVNSYALNVTQMTGDVVFEAKTSGKYYVYYMPYLPEEAYSIEKSNYFVPNQGIDKEWVKRNGLENPNFGSMPKAKQVEIQARDEFNSMYFMEVPASKEEKASLEKTNEFPYMIFCEDRLNHIKMKDYVPYKWYKSGEITSFEGTVQPGEIYAFQVGIYAKEDLKMFNVKSEDLEGENLSGFKMITDTMASAGDKLMPGEIHCINTQGTDYRGREFAKILNIKKGTVQPLWFYVKLPKEAKGTYTGKILLTSQNCPDRYVTVKLKTKGDYLPDGGVSDLWRMSRLCWLDSTLAQNESVVAPYTNVEVKGDTAKILEREITFGKLGFPKKIVSFGNSILNSPIDFNVFSDGNKIKWGKTDKEVIVQKEGTYEFENISYSDKADLRVKGRLEFDGTIEYKVSLTAKCDTKLNAQLLTVMNSDFAKYIMGMGLAGGYAPDYYEYQMNPDRVDYIMWLGDYDAGLGFYFKTKDDKYKIYGPVEEELLNEGWYNNGKGLCTFTRHNKNYAVDYISGDREFKAGDTVTYNFRLTVTPFKPFDKKFYSYRSGGADTARGNIYHLHHGNDPNRYINYPFLDFENLKKRAEEIHHKQVGYNTDGTPRYLSFDMNLYYTSRELTNHCYELWALRSLGDEIFDNTSFIYTANGATQLFGDGGGYQWLNEHCQRGYVPAWHYSFGEDHCAAMATKFDSRWLNYYVEGMNYIEKNTFINGLYLDGIGYDREITKRIARVMEKYHPNYRIQFHAGNNYDYLDRKSNTYCTGMDHIPFLTDFWTGEFFHFDNTSPQYMFTEISGIPFGVKNNTLDNFSINGGNPYKSMIFSMNQRGQSSYWAMIDMWDETDIHNRKMVGYWDRNPLVTVKGDNNVFATCYVKEKSVLICAANWNVTDAKADLVLDWKKCGLNPKTAKIRKINFDGYQKEEYLNSLEGLEFAKDGGAFIEVYDEN